MNGLAVLHTKQKQYDEAECLFHEALEASKLKLGEDHPDTLESKNDLAILYKGKLTTKKRRNYFAKPSKTNFSNWVIFTHKRWSLGTT